MGEVVSTNDLTMLGVPPIRGRTFTPAEKAGNGRRS